MSAAVHHRAGLGRYTQELTRVLVARGEHAYVAFYHQRGQAQLDPPIDRLPQLTTRLSVRPWRLATMLAYLFTDAALSAPILKTLLKAETETSFNSITVDGDRSTNDCVLLFATGQAKVPPIADANDARLADFRAALSHVLADLAIQIVRDGEGATKLVTVRVEGAANDRSAKRIARTICESPLVKTAIAGEDANWGRIVMAIGRSDEPVKREMIAVRFGDLYGARHGMVSPDYDEERWFSDGERLHHVIAWMPAPEAARGKVAP